MFATLILPFVALLSHSSVAQLIHGVDSSQLVPQGTYSTALSEGFTKAIIRGFREACSSGGLVDSNLVGSYNNAVAAGYGDIDVYLFPCTGTTNSCKTYDEQVGELTNTIITNGLSIGTIWIDIEQDTVCNGWDYGATENLNQAQSLVSAAQASGFTIGIYSSPGEWANIFGSHDVVVDNTLPLWFATFDNDDSSLTMRTPFGGWTSAVGKQYTDQSASGFFDLNIFAA